MALIEVDVSVKQACSESWSAMQGDSRSRYCGVCSNHVQDLARLTRPETELLAMRAAAGDRVCARVTKRGDGSLVTLPENRSSTPVMRGLVMSAALAAGLPAAAQTPASGTVAREQIQALPEVPQAPFDDPGKAVVIGRLLRPDGSHVDSGLISVDGRWYVADDRGRFEIHAAPGAYDFTMQTGPDQAGHVLAVVLHEGVQSFGDVQMQAGQPGIMDSDTTMGEIVLVGTWSWRARLRHPVLYARSVLRKMR